MKRKALGYLLILISLPLLCGGLVFGYSEYQIRRVYDIPAVNLTIPTDKATLARGQHLVEVIGGCPECHAYSLKGDPNFLNEPLIGQIPAANLTPHQTGVGSIYTAADWERAIRHGVGRDGRALIGVSSGALQHLSNADVAAIIAYLQTIPPGKREIPPRQVGLLARPFLLLGLLLFWCGVGVWAQLDRYEHVADLAQKQQIKWAALGLLVAAAAPFTYTFLLFISPAVDVPHVPNLFQQRLGTELFTTLVTVRFVGLTAVRLLTLLFPLSFAIAILRYRLWDIDLLINRRPTALPEAFPDLTDREREVLALLARGFNNGDIARKLHISQKTVRNHCSNIFSKLQVADRAQAIIRAREAGIGRGRT